MKLTERDAKVARYLEQRGRASAAEIAKALHLQLHTTHYIIERLRSERVLRRRVFINCHRLGFLRLAIFLSLPAMSARRYQTLVQDLKVSEQVSLLLELGGAYHLEVNLLGRDIAQMRAHLDLLMEKVGSPWISKTVALQVEHFIYGTKVIGNLPLNLAPLGYHVNENLFEIDLLDHEILRALMSDESHSLREIAHRLSEAPSTVEYRVKKLEEAGVITGYTYLLERLDLIHYVLLVHLKTNGASQRVKLSKFAQLNKYVFYTVENIGSWDFEVGLVVRDPREVMRATQDLYEAFGDDIARTEQLSILERPKVQDYPGILPRPTNSRAKQA